MCMTDGGDFYNKVARTEHPTAHKTHRCGECERTIDPGERYRLDVTLSDGYWWRHKTCAHCDVGRTWLNAECGAYYFEMVADDVLEHWEESDLLKSWQMARWIVGERHRWRRRDGSLMPVPSPIPVPTAVPS